MTEHDPVAGIPEEASGTPENDRNNLPEGEDANDDEPELIPDQQQGDEEAGQEEDDPWRNWPRC